MYIIKALDEYDDQVNNRRRQEQGFLEEGESDRNYEQQEF